MRIPGAIWAFTFRLATALLKPWPIVMSWFALTPFGHGRRRGVLVRQALELLREGAAEREGEAGKQALRSPWATRTRSSRAGRRGGCG